MTPQPSPLRLTPVKSSHLHSIGYNPVSQTLDIQFLSGGKTYRYSSVPPQIHSTLLSSPSKGKFFHKHIKDRFAHTSL